MLGRVIAVDVDSGENLFRTARAPVPVALGWTAESQQLVVLTEQAAPHVPGAAHSGARDRDPQASDSATALAARPNSNDVAYSVYSERTGQGTIFLFNGRFSRPLFSGGGRFEDIVWSPDGRLLLVPWAAADQWLFVPVQGQGKVVTRTDVAQQFDPGATTAGAFPRVEGWVKDDGGRAPGPVLGRPAPVRRMPGTPARPGPARHRPGPDPAGLAERRIVPSAARSRRRRLGTGMSARNPASRAASVSATDTAASASPSGLQTLNRTCGSRPGAHRSLEASSSLEMLHRMFSGR